MDNFLFQVHLELHKPLDRETTKSIFNVECVLNDFNFVVNGENIWFPPILLTEQSPFSRAKIHNFYFEDCRRTFFIRKSKRDTHCSVQETFIA